MNDSISLAFPKNALSVDEENTESLKVRFILDNPISSPSFYDETPVEVQHFIDDLGGSVFDPDGGHAIVLGDPTAGKTYIIEQFAYNIDRFIELSDKQELHMILLSEIEQEVIERIPGTWRTYIRILTEELKCSEKEICFITESSEIARNIFSISKGINVILETSVYSFVQIIKSENTGQSKLWGSWRVIDVNDLYLSKKNLINTLYHELAPKYEDSSYVLDKKTITLFVSYSLRNMKELFVDDKVIVPPGFWINAVKRIMGLMIFSSDESIMDKKQKSITKVVKKVFEEYKGSFLESIQNYQVDESSNMDDPMNSVMDQIFSGLFPDDGNNSPKRIIVSPSGLPGFGAHQDDYQEINALQYSNMETLGDRLKTKILGQDSAIDKIVDSLLVSAAGLHDEKKPVRSFLFLGPTGVGKTELALNIAKETFTEEMNVVRLDMSEYVHPADASKLFGAAPGYVGYSEGGVLTNAIKKHPYSLILLDEVEKAHSQVWDSFLQIFDAGRMTGGDGEVVDFCNSIIVMTSNLGIKDLNRAPSGFITQSTEELYNQRQKDAQSTISKAVSEFFKPEFINRIDEMIIFNELSKDTALLILQKELNTVFERAKKKGFVIENVNDDILNRLLELSDISKFGAREIQRIILRNVSNPLAQKMISNSGKHIELSLNSEGKIEVSMQMEKERG